MENNQSVKKSKDQQTNTKSIGVEAASGQTKFKFFVTSEIITEHTEYLEPKPSAPSAKSTEPTELKEDKHATSQGCKTR